MSHTEEPILRTSPARLGKLLAILIGIMVVGGVIFFANYDYWNSYLPTAGKIQEGLGAHRWPPWGCFEPCGSRYASGQASWWCSPNRRQPPRAATARSVGAK